MKKWFLTLMCMLAASAVMVGCSANTMSTAPTASPMTTTAAPTNSPMATAEATAEPAPRDDGGHDARAGGAAG